MSSSSPMDSVRVASVTTVRASQPVVRAFTNYHRSLGIDPVILFFDDPDDPAAAEMEGSSGVEVIRCDSSHWLSFLGQVPGTPDRWSFNTRQVLNATRGRELAVAAGAAWIAHIDSDELIHVTRGRLRDVLGTQASNVDAVLLRPAEAVPENPREAVPFLGVSEFRTLHGSTLPISWRANRRLNRVINLIDNAVARVSGGKDVVYGGEYFRGYSSYKSITRTSSRRVASIGVHNPIPNTDERLTVRYMRDARVLHFDCANFEEWLAKWYRRHDNPSRYTRMRRNRQMQRDEFSRAVETGRPDALESLYRRMYFVPEETRRRLARVGMIKRLAIDPTRFELDTKQRDP